MYNQRKLFFLICLIIAPVFFIWGEIYVLDYTPADFSFYTENGFDRIKTSNFALIGEPGTPELPAVFLNYIIPPNAKAESIIVTKYNIHPIPGEYLVYPAQPSAIIGETAPWVPPDVSIYNSNELFPKDFIHVMDEGIMDGARIVTVKVQPLQYHPKIKKLFLISHIEFIFSFGFNTMPKIRAQIRGKFEQAIYDAAIGNIVTNDYEIPLYYQRPMISEECQLLSAPPTPPVGPSIIITPSEFFDAFQPYADWLTDQGIPTILISPQTIYDYAYGIDKADKIRNYIRECYIRGGGTFFILGGDDHFLPVRYGTPGPGPGANDSIPCDMYFSDLTGNWDANNNNIWGELDGDSADCFPEVFVGRITAYNETEVQNWVTKALHYEQTPGVIFDSVLWIYSTAVGLGDAPSAFPSHLGHIYAENYYADDAFALIDQGYGLLNVNCHGTIKDFRVGYGDIENWSPYPPDESQAGLNYLSNCNKYFVGYAVSCYIGAFDSLGYAPGQLQSDTCIIDAFVDAYAINAYNETGPFGACAFLANTRIGVLQSLDLQYVFWNKIMNPRYYPLEPVITHIGVAEALSKCDELIDWTNLNYRKVCYTHNLFGSPYFEPWTKTPGNMFVLHPTQVQAGVEIQFTVTVRNNTIQAYCPHIYQIAYRPIKNAKVCLNKTDDIYEVGFTNKEGRITFTITPQTTGTIKVTVTRLHHLDNNYTQYIPSQTTCSVYSGSK
jgi:hypothetical protein